VTRKGQGHDPNIFRLIISTTAGDTELVTMGQLGNGYLGIKWSRDPNDVSDSQYAVNWCDKLTFFHLLVLIKATLLLTCLLT